MAGEIPELIETSPVEVICPDLYEKLLAGQALDNIVLGED